MKSDLNVLNDEETAMIVICSTFLLMNDLAYVRKENLERIIHTDKVKQNMLRLLNDMDGEVDGSIKKLQLFYALHKQRENLNKKIKKITWSGVTSSWGPKIVMSDGESYYYIFNDFTEFDEYREKYNIAAKLGAAPQYRSEYVDEGEDFNLRIIRVIATLRCRTLAEFFTAENLGKKGEFSKSKLPERLSEEFFRNELDATMNVSSDELMAVLPRLTSGDIDPCVDSILKKTDEWNIPRVKITYENDAEETQTYFVVHGDEWGGNFLVTEKAEQVYVIDYEDAIYSNSNNQGEVQQVGGDLSSRIFNPEKMKKTEDSLEDQGLDFSPIGLSVFASIGRLMAALVQYHSRWRELEKDGILGIVDTYLKSFEISFSEKNSILRNDHWESNYKPMILLHAWDWAIYWNKKGRFPAQHYDKFIDEIKKILGCDESPNIKTYGDTTPPSPSESVFEYPEEGNASAKKSFGAAFKMQEKKKNDSAYDTCLQAYSIVKESGSSTEKAFVSLWLGLIASWTDKSESVALGWFKKTIHVFEEYPDQVIVKLDSRDENILLECYDKMVWLYWLMEDYENAETVLRRWFALYWGDEDYSDSLTIEHILEQPDDVKKGDIEFHFDSIWENAAKLYYSKGEYEIAAKIYDRLAKQESDDSKADRWRMCTGIAYSRQGDYEKAELIQRQCLEYRKRAYRQNSDGDGRLVTQAQRNLGQNAMAWKKYAEAKKFFASSIHGLQKIPREIISRDELENYIKFNEQQILLCTIQEEIKSVLFHYSKRNERIAELVQLRSKSNAHYELCLAPLLRLANTSDKYLNKNQIPRLEEFDKSTLLEITDILILRFGDYELARSVMFLIDDSTLKENEIIFLCRSYERIRLNHDGVRTEELDKYHDELEARYSVNYPSILEEYTEGEPEEKFHVFVGRSADLFIRVLIDSGHIDSDDSEEYYNETFREILIRLFDDYPLSLVLRTIEFNLGGHAVPDVLNRQMSSDDLRKIINQYSVKLYTNVDVIWDNAQTTFDGITEALVVLASALCDLKRSKKNSLKQYNYSVERFKETGRLIEPWFRRTKQSHEAYKRILKFIVSENDARGEIEFFRDMIRSLKKIEKPMMKRCLFHLYSKVWMKSEIRKKIHSKEKGYMRYSNSVFEMVEFLCLWKAEDPEKFSKHTILDGNGNFVVIDPRTYLVKQLIGYYDFDIPKEWPFDVLQTRPKEMEGQQTKTIRSTEFKQEIEIAELERQSGSWSKSIERLKLVVHASKEAKEYLFCADALNDLGTCYFEQERFDKAKEYYEEAMDLYCQIEDKEGEVDSLMNLALIANERKRFLDAEAKFDKCLDIYTALGQEVGVADVHINRADIRIEQEHYPEARENIQIALGIFKALNDKKWYLKWATALNVSADLYRKLDCFDEAINELEQAKSLSEEINDIKGLSDLYNNFGIAHMQYGKLLSFDGAPEAVKEFKKAEKYFRKHLETIAEIEERPNKWFEDNGFYTDSKIWSQFPPNDSPDWK
ncbi:tetratricopeptide repeat protein [Candidatus Poseidoniales archaeon]|nr:tetratricopeptide repeat protein [Candidatus Poseidoniales archaeon]